MRVACAPLLTAATTFRSTRQPSSARALCAQLGAPALGSVGLRFRAAGTGTARDACRLRRAATTAPCSLPRHVQRAPAGRSCLAHPLHLEHAHPYHIGTGAGLIPATSALGLGSVVRSVSAARIALLRIIVRFAGRPSARARLLRRLSPFFIVCIRAWAPSPCRICTTETGMSYVTLSAACCRLHTAMPDVVSCVSSVRRCLPPVVFWALSCSCCLRMMSSSWLHADNPTRTHTRARTHTRTRAHTQYYAHTLARTHTHTRTRAHTQYYAHTLARTHTHTRTRARTHTLTHAHAHLHPHAHARTRAHTHTHAHSLNFETFVCGLLGTAMRPICAHFPRPS
jgi:hypothetical protein